MTVLNYTDKKSENDRKLVGANGQAVSDTRTKQDMVLRLFGESGRLIDSLNKVGVKHPRHYDWLESDSSYVERFARAKQQVADKLEQEIWRRAHDGVPVQVGWYKGKAGGVEQRYSDQLAMFRMKSLRPDEYRDTMQVDTNTNVHITVDDARARLVAMMERNPLLVQQIRDTMGDATVDGALVEGGGDPQFDEDDGVNIPTPYSDQPKLTKNPSDIPTPYSNDEQLTQNSVSNGEQDSAVVEVTQNPGDMEVEGTEEGMGDGVPAHEMPLLEEVDGLLMDGVDEVLAAIPLKDVDLGGREGVKVGGKVIRNEVLVGQVVKGVVHDWRAERKAEFIRLGKLAEKRKGKIAGLLKKHGAKQKYVLGGGLKKDEAQDEEDGTDIGS